ncbi:MULTISPECIES: hypothetical protein [Corynebacterium]|uniref:hypothetical protein n=1 Tax=Corynebacterium TaxID=1716 RepID=UPI001EF320D9|nr:hypothetical protein [Corynebacterium kefirresidentii]MCG7283702.1 hypothetical protein [Corynebacterium kefirresidentii]
MPFAENVAALLDTTASISRERSRPQERLWAPVVEWEEQVLRRLATDLGAINKLQKKSQGKLQKKSQGSYDLPQALQYTNDLLTQIQNAFEDFERAYPVEAKQLDGEVTAVHKFHRMLLPSPDGDPPVVTSPQKGKKDGRPLKKALTMSKTVIDSIKDLLGESDKVKVAATLWSEAVDLLSA